MKAYRVIPPGVWWVEVSPEQGGFRIQAMGRCEDGTPEPGEGTPCFWQVEQLRGNERVVVALAIGPRQAKHPEPDWGRAVFSAVLNPAPALSYGGRPASDRGERVRLAPDGPVPERVVRSREGLSDEEVARRRKNCEASKRSREKRAAAARQAAG